MPEVTVCPGCKDECSRQDWCELCGRCRRCCSCVELGQEEARSLFWDDSDMELDDKTYFWDRY